MKVTVVGAGAVGATCADNIARAELAEELVLLDIKEGLAEGKAQDMMQTAALLGFDTRITGSTNDYSKTAGKRCSCDHIRLTPQTGYDARGTDWYQCRYCERRCRKHSETLA